MSAINIRRVTMRKPEALPIIRRSRSWRGVMQVKFDDNRSDRSTMTRQFFLWSPLRIFGCIFVTTSVAYIYMGHDHFMHSAMGYESEMQYECQVNPTENAMLGSMLDKDRGWRKSMRNLEKPLHPVREFDVMKHTAASEGEGGV